MNYHTDSTSKIHPSADIGAKTIIEEYTIIGENVKIGFECKIHRNIYIDNNVSIGNRVKIQDCIMIPEGVTIEDGAFIGPCVAFTNDLYPRSITSDGKLKNAKDWKLSKTLIKRGASLGANSTILCGIVLGEWCMIGAGSVVTKNIPAHALVMGNPARIAGWVNKNGEKMEIISERNNQVILWDNGENKEYIIDM